MKGTLFEIADKFGVHFSTIGKIKTLKNYGRVNGGSA